MGYVKAYIPVEIPPEVAVLKQDARNEHDRDRKKRNVTARDGIDVARDWRVHIASSNHKVLIDEITQCWMFISKYK